MKKFSLFLLIAGSLVLYLTLKPIDSKVNAKIIFINQVRGTECCQKGSYEYSNNQLKLFKKNGIPATFLLRYDAINSSQFVSLFKSYKSNVLNYGIFFEITPRLAKDAGVVYKGTEERWYRAQYAYLVGYSQEERKKLIDTAMALFKRQFGFFPNTTGGWMIDTFSAEYLSGTYGVKFHEITREQWGTDGYALYGGSVLSSYIPSKRWIFLPAQNPSDSLPLSIIRQTLSDPVRNYGDLTSGYTSQPNDYGRTRSFDYFKQLLRQVEGYSQPLAVLGLENSLEKKYQDIYEKQVEYVTEMIDKKNIILPNAIMETGEANFVTGTDFDNYSYKAFWIETIKYRVRIIQKNNYIQLTDLRVFDAFLKDPYYATPSGEKTAFWETPYVFDSSKNGIHKTIDTLTLKAGDILRFFGNDDWIRERTNPVVNEQFLSEVTGIVFPKLKLGTSPSINKQDKKIVLRYISENNKTISFIFSREMFLAEGISKNDYEIKGQMGQSTELLQEQKDNGVLFTPLSNQRNSSVATMRSETTTDTQEQQPNIGVIYNAPLSLIGRNPVRLIIVSKDSGGNPVRIKNMKIAYRNGSFNSVTTHETEGHLGAFDGTYYVDIEENNAGTYIPILTYGSKQKELTPISFVFDCKKNIQACLFSPQKMLDYMRVKVGDILNRR